MNASRSIILRLAHSVPTAVRPSPRVCQVAAMFGLGVDEQRQLTIVPPIELELAVGSIIFITGASGGGKTTLLRLIAQQLKDRDDARVVPFDGARGDNAQPIVEAIGGTLEQATRWLALAGLNDAFVMLRQVGQLSDGQRARLALAQAIARAETPEAGAGAGAAAADAGADADVPPPLQVMLADEFCSSLDRLTAQVICRSVRKWVTRQGVCLVAATAHDDLLEPLEPDVLVVQHPGEAIEVLRRAEARRHEGGAGD